MDAAVAAMALRGKGRTCCSSDSMLMAIDSESETAWLEMSALAVGALVTMLGAASRTPGDVVDSRGERSTNPLLLVMLLLLLPQCRRK